ncbi:hypothetical protein Hanom_Chr02g00122691 [Helianthus anomalus]
MSFLSFSLEYYYLYIYFFVAEGLSISRDRGNVCLHLTLPRSYHPTSSSAICGITGFGCCCCFMIFFLVSNC